MTKKAPNSTRPTPSEATWAVEEGMDDDDDDDDDTSDKASEDVHGE